MQNAVGERQRYKQRYDDALYEKTVGNDDLGLELVDVMPRPNTLYPDTPQGREEEHEDVTALIRDQWYGPAYPDAETVPAEAFAADMSVQESAVYDLLAAPLQGNTGDDGFTTDVLASLYSEDGRPEHMEATDTVILHEADYFPEDHPVDGRHYALRQQGEIDVAAFTVSNEPAVNVTEVKRYSKDGRAKAFEQIADFTEYAGTLGWDVDGDVAFYTDESDYVIRCQQAE